MSRHKKKSSMHELAVNVEGPIKFIGGSSTNIQYQRLPQSATQPQITGLSYNPNRSAKDINIVNQGFTPTYPPMQNHFAQQVRVLSTKFSINPYSSPNCYLQPKSQTIRSHLHYTPLSSLNQQDYRVSPQASNS